MIKYYNVNGSLILKEEAKIGIDDLALLRAFGIFDYFRFEDGKAVLIDDHLDRFFRSAKRMGLDVPYSKASLKRQIIELSVANGLDSAGIRMILTGGYSSDGFTPSKPNLLILQRPYTPYSPGNYKNGVKLILWKHVREIPEVKTINYIVPILSLKKQREENAWDILYHDGKLISETSRANFFIFTKDGTLVTPASGVLEGINRKYILSIAQQHFSVEERDVTIEEMLNAKEVFLSSSTMRMMPVAQVDDHTIGSGKPGEHTIRLRELLLAYLEEKMRATV